MNSLGDIIPEAILPDREPWRNLLKGDAYQAGPHLIVGDQWLELAEFGGGRHAHFEFVIGNTFIDGELDALLLLPYRRTGRLPKAFQYEDFRKVGRPLPLWDKTRWIIRCSKAPYSQSYQSNPPVVFPCMIAGRIPTISTFTGRASTWRTTPRKQRNCNASFL